MAGLPALGKLVDAINRRAFGKDGRGFVFGLDGGKIKTRHRHAALNTLLQSAGAIIMKQGLVILDDSLQEAGLVPGVDYEFVANIHDEWQLDVLPQHVDHVKETAAWAIKRAGEVLNFVCPLAGNSDTGMTWADTH